MNDQLQTVTNEAAAIANEAMNDAGFQKMLKFKRNGDTSVYLRDGEEVELGTQMICHCIGWTKTWVKFWDNKVAERKVYRVGRKEVAPERDELSDNDPMKWQLGLDNRPRDPWVLQYLLPMEDPESGEVCIFIASSFGGKRAVADICQTWATKARRNPNVGQPLVRLQKTMFPTKNYGNVVRPSFELVGFVDSTQAEPLREIDTKTIEADTDMNDEIPF
jgi:hypothetical protein